jgi:tetratricopeptide (TPR) repeat protein
MLIQLLSRSTVAAAGLMLLLAVSPAAQAALFKDAHFQTLLDADRYEDLDLAAKTRLKGKPDDVQALAAAAMAGSDAYDAQRLEAAAKFAQACREREPREAACHYAAAEVMGHQVQMISPLKAVGMVVRLKETLHKALELDPALYAARSKLVQLYLFTPQMLGGSTAKAKALEAEIRASQPEQARLLRSLIAAAAEKWPEAERELMAVRTGADGALQADVREAYSQLGRHWMKEQQFDKAKSLYQQLQRDQPGKAMAAYCLARLAMDQQQYEEAVRQLERAKTLGGAQQLPLDHRLGEALLGLGDKGGAKAAFARAAADKRVRPNYAKDARKSLAELG